MASIIGDTNPTAEWMSVRFAQDQEDVALEQEDVVPDIGFPRTFLSSKRHLITTPEDPSERWGLSLAQAALTLKATTQRLTISALMPLAQRYRADRMFDVRQIHGTMSNDTMNTRCQSIHQDKYLQVFGNKDFFVEAYPIKSFMTHIRSEERRGS